MFRISRIVMIAIAAGFLATSHAAEIDDSPGRLLTGKAVYDAKRFAKLFPASLFDKDNSPSLFRLGIVWDERYGDEVKLIVTFPITGEVSMEDLKKSAGSFQIRLDGKPTKPERVRNSIILRQKTKVFSKEYEAEISYLSSRKYVEALLAAELVEFEFHILAKSYETTLKVTDKARVHYHDANYTAINGFKRFQKAVWERMK